MDVASREQIAQLQEALSKATSRGDLKWERVAPSAAMTLVPPEASPTNVFRCSFEGASWLLAEYVDRLYDGENDRWFDQEQTQLSLLQGNLRVFDFPPALGLEDLMSTVKAQSVGLQELMNRILKK